MVEGGRCDWSQADRNVLHDCATDLRAADEREYCRPLVHEITEGQLGLRRRMRMSRLPAVASLQPRETLAVEAAMAGWEEAPD